MVANLLPVQQYVDLTNKAIMGVVALYLYQLDAGQANADMAGLITVCAQTLPVMNSTILAWIGGNSSTNGIFANAISTVSAVS